MGSDDIAEARREREKRERLIREGRDLCAADARGYLRGELHYSGTEAFMTVRRAWEAGRVPLLWFDLLNHAHEIRLALDCTTPDAATAEDARYSVR